MEFNTTPLLLAGGFLATIAVALAVLGELGLRDMRREERENEKHHG